MKLNDFKKIVDASKLSIKKVGYKGYLSSVKEKLKNKDFSIIDHSNELTMNENLQEDIPKLPPLTNEQEEILEKKMVWIFSPPRSGTTWIGSQLLRHPENIIWYEPWIGFHIGIVDNDKNIQQEEPQFERIFDTHASSSSYFFSPHHKKNWQPALKKFLLTRAYSESQTLTKNLIIKEPVGSHGADIIMECFPNSKLIFLQRDGRDVVDSRLDMHGKKTWAKLKPINTPKSRRKNIVWYSFQWNKINERINRAFVNHNPKLRLVIKYEELKKNTLSELKKIYDFLDIKISDDELQKIIDAHDFKKIPAEDKGKGKFYRSASPGGWKNNFTKEEQDLMNSIMGKALKEMRYQI